MVFCYHNFKVFSSCQKGTTYLLSSHSLFPTSIVLTSCRCSCLMFCCFMTSFLYLTCLWGSSILSHFSVLHFSCWILFHWWTSGWFPLLGYSEYCHPEHPCVRFCVDMFSLQLIIYLQVELLDHIVTLCLTFWGITRFSKWPHHFTFSLALYKSSSFSTSLLTFIFLFFDYSHPVLICISLGTNGAEHIFKCYQPFVYL